MKLSTGFTRNQTKIWLACFISYTAAYVARLNMGAALGSVIADMRLTDAQGGMFQTLFALVYAAGQLVNGAIVDRISARRYIAAGLLLSGVCNLLFSLMPSYGTLLLCWGLNGAAQSMLWTPIVKVMAVWFKGKRRTKASFGISMTLVLGHLAAWAISGMLASRVGWRLSFLIPAILVGTVAVVSYMLMRDEPAPGEDVGEEDTGPDTASREKSTMPLGEMFMKTGLIMVLGCCVCNGFVRDGIIAWGPTILSKLGGEGIGSVLTSLIIPVLNLAGMLMGRRIYTLLGSNARLSVAMLMAVSAVLAIGLHLAGGALLSCALVLGLCCAATYGINPMLTQFIPMEYERAGRVGLAAGLSDCFIYLGSSLSGVATGALSDAAGWPLVFTAWCAVAAASTAFALLSGRGWKYLTRR